MRRLLAAISALPLVAAAQLNIPTVPLPMTLGGVTPYVWTNAIWWTNSPPQTNIQSWQAWWAVNENMSRLTNALATNAVCDLLPQTAAATNATAIRLWNSNNVAVYARGTNGVNKLLISWP